MTREKFLSKTDFLRGVRCKKSLYLDRHHEALRDAAEAGVQRRMSEGQAVHELARELFPGGDFTGLDASFNVQASLKNTGRLVAQGAPILYEAAVEQERVLAFVDMLVRENGSWSLYEVKSATDVKEHYIWDVGLQIHLLLANGYDLGGAYLVHVNNQYVRDGSLDPEGFFTRVPVYEEAFALQSQIEHEIAACKSVLSEASCPDCEIGPYCNDPDVCDFKGHCWAHVPELSVFNVSYLGKKAFDLYEQGVMRIEDIPGDFPMSSRSSFHVEAHKSGEPVVDRSAIAGFLQALTYPLFFLDFETFMMAIPPYDGMKPYAQVPYQYSLHVMRKPGEKPIHTGFLAQAGIDPRPSLMDQLLCETEGSGDIVVYNKSFEKNVLQKLAEQFPEHRDWIEDRIERLVDLMTPFQKRHLYLPAMHGSSSLKAVLPVMVPGAGYDDLTISDGHQAMEAYFELSDTTDPGQIETLREALWKYCEMDTLAMVEVLERLRSYT